ncbi:hypothetical protein [Streptomyces sp. A5-4]|uniref:hypothetical protein n=1 Tax=Streptomyces sp. A5-4 TaxID=3384771 RepID=UPI003DA9E1DB
MNRWLKPLCWYALLWVGLLLYGFWQTDAWGPSLVVATVCVPFVALFSWLRDRLRNRAQGTGSRIRRRLRGRRE